jgi:hypothetical protein
MFGNLPNPPTGSRSNFGSGLQRPTAGPPAPGLSSGSNINSDPFKQILNEASTKIVSTTPSVSKIVIYSVYFVEDNNNIQNGTYYIFWSDDTDKKALLVASLNSLRSPASWENNNVDNVNDSFIVDRIKSFRKVSTYLSTGVKTAEALNLKIIGYNLLYYFVSKKTNTTLPKPYIYLEGDIN